MVTLKWLSPPSRAPAWPEWRPESSSISRRVGWKAAVSLSWIASSMAPIGPIFNSCTGVSSPHTWPMPGAFQYKPKFVDIRVKPPKAEEPDEQDVNALKPGERACDHAGCRRAATARAPKSREMMNEHYWFCQEHAAEYNRNWNFFAGMSEGEVKAFQRDELFTGGRPTWEMKAGKFSREAAAFNHRFKRGDGYRD